MDKYKREIGRMKEKRGESVEERERERKKEIKMKEERQNRG